MGEHVRALQQTGRMPRPWALVVAVALPAQLLHRASALLRLQSLLALTRTWLCRPAFFWPLRGMLQQRDEPRPRRVAVLRLGAVLAAVDEQHAVCGAPISSQGEQSLFHVRWQGRAGAVDADRDPGRYLGHALSAS